MSISSFLVGLAVLAVAPAAEPVLTIERDDPRLDALIPADAVIEVLASGYGWAEGPAWDVGVGHLLFSDVPGNVIWRWKPGEGASEFLRPSGYTGAASRLGQPGSNGLFIDQAGNLLACEHGDRRVSRRTPAGVKTTLADRYDGKRFNSPNDLCVASNGAIYFTDPPYGLGKGRDDPARELAFCGVFRLDPDGQVRLLTDALTLPNGIALSPDQRTLYVAVSDIQAPKIHAFPVTADGIGTGRVLYDAGQRSAAGRRGLPDGLRVDRAGNLFATGPGGVLVLTSTGDLLGTITVGSAAANCAWGDDDGGALYITAKNRLLRLRTTTRGAGWP